MAHGPMPRHDRLQAEPGYRCDAVEPDHALEAHRLQRKGVGQAADQSIGARADDDSGAGGSPGIGAGERARAECDVKENTAQAKVTLLLTPAWAPKR